MNRYLFVIDYQNDFVDGALGFPGAETLDEKIAAKIRAYGKGRVFFTRDTHFADYLDTREGKNLPVVHCVKVPPAGRSTVRLPRPWQKWRPRPLTSCLSAWTFLTP